MLQYHIIYYDMHALQERHILWYACNMIIMQQHASIPKAYYYLVLHLWLRI